MWTARCDSNYLHAVTWWQAFAQAGHDVPMAAIHRAIGIGSDQLLDALLPAAGQGRRSGHPRRAWRAVCHLLVPARALPRAPELLRLPGVRPAGGAGQLRRPAGVRRAPCGPGCGGRHRGNDLAGDVDQSKPAPDLVQVALGKVGVAPERAVFVGDTVWDVQACQRAGVPCIGLRSGGISTAELLDAGAAAVFAGRADLLESTGERLAEALPAPGS